MKKTFITILALAMGVTAGAQDYYSAGKLNGNLYYGTARSIALGNAMTAVGGDPGSVTINPAGSAVAGYSQFTITPSLSFSGVSASFNPGNQAIAGRRSDKTSFGIPNFALSLYMSGDNGSPFSGISLGLVANTSDNYNSVISAGGVNPFSSFAAAMASAASLSPLGHEDNLSTLAAYKSYMISPGMMVDGYQLYQAVTESDYDRIAGPLNQRSTITEKGTKTDLAFNLGLNLQNRVYLGANVTVLSSDNRYIESFTEAAQDVTLFPATGYDGSDTFFDHLDYNYDLYRSAGAVAVKLGAIVLPFSGLRLGAAVQFPTRYRIDDSYSVYSSVDYADGTYRDSGNDLTGSWSYSLRTPWKIGAGAAYTFLDRGILSFDYEIEDYSSLQYVSDRQYEYDSVNAVNSLFYGTKQSFRAGLEYRVTPAFSLRLGYGVTTSPECYYESAGGGYVSADNFSYSDYNSGRLALGDRIYFSDLVKSASCGFGYSSAGSFYADFALRRTSFPGRFYTPYPDYLYDDHNNLTTPSPTVSFTRNLVDAVLTLGWRF